MAFYVGSTNVFPGKFPQPPVAGAVLFNDGTNGYWSYPGNSAQQPASGLRYRSTLTHGYIAGGYKGSCPWRSVNRTWHSTDITMYCGEQLAWAANYLEGTWSDYNAYVHNTADAYASASAGTQSYNLANGTLRTRGSNTSGTYSPPGSGFGFPTNTGTSGVGGWNLSVSRGPYLGCAVNQTGQAGYIAGSSTVVDKMHFPSETMFNTTAAPASGFTSGCHGESRGYFSFGGSKNYITYSNDSWTSWTSSTSPDGWCKYLSTKWGHHYGGNGGNVTTGVTKFSDSTGSDINTGLSKVRSCGEENMQMGQDWGYMMGNYDGQQNNHTVKTTYSTDVLLQMGAACMPKGHVGQSSGACFTAAASITSVLPL